MRRMTTHELKTWTESFDAMWRGDKHHEVRVDDRGYQVGDTLLFREYDPKMNQYLGRRMLVLVTYISRAPFVPEGLCVMSIAHLNTNGEVCCAMRAAGTHDRGQYHKAHAGEACCMCDEPAMGAAPEEPHARLREAG